MLKLGTFLCPLFELSVIFVRLKNHAWVELVNFRNFRQFALRLLKQLFYCFCAGFCINTLQRPHRCCCCCCCVVSSSEWRESILITNISLCGISCNKKQSKRREEGKSSRKLPIILGGNFFFCFHHNIHALEAGQKIYGNALDLLFIFIFCDFRLNFFCFLSPFFPSNKKATSSPSFFLSRTQSLRSLFSFLPNSRQAQPPPSSSSSSLLACLSFAFWWMAGVAVCQPKRQQSSFCRLGCLRLLLLHKRER